MDFIPYRLLRNQPRELRQRLENNGELVVMHDGKPFAMMIGVDQDNLNDVMTLVTQMRAQKAVSAMRAAARERGLDRIKTKDIDAEIKKVRARRKV
jgi:hypothetical protein